MTGDSSTTMRTASLCWARRRLSSPGNAHGKIERRTTTDAGDGGAALNYLFESKSVAIVGASTDRYKLGGQPVYFSKLLGFSGTMIYPLIVAAAGRGAAIANALMVRR